MGLVASQARICMLTGQNSDLEFRGENIAENRMQLMDSMDQMNNLTNQMNTQMNQYQQEYANIAKEMGEKATNGFFGAIKSAVKKIGSFFKHLFGGKTKEDKKRENLEQELNSIKQKAEALQNKEKTNQTSLKATQKKDKILEINSKLVDTQHKSVQAQLENIEKSVNKNIENSFKILS